MTAELKYVCRWLSPSLSLNKDFCPHTASNLFWFLRRFVTHCHSVRLLLLCDCSYLFLLFLFYFLVCMFVYSETPLHCHTVKIFRCVVPASGQDCKKKLWVFMADEVKRNTSQSYLPHYLHGLDFLSFCLWKWMQRSFNITYILSFTEMLNLYLRISLSKISVLRIFMKLYSYLAL